MAAMLGLRRRRPSAYLRPEPRVLRTLQAPQHVTHDGAAGWRPSSAIFSAGTDHTTSVDLEQLLHEDGLSPTALFPTLKRSVGLVAVTVGEVRAAGLPVDHDPVLANWYHGVITDPPNSKNHKARRALAKKCTVVVPIDEAAAEAFHQEQLAKNRAAQQPSLPT